MSASSTAASPTTTIAHDLASALDKIGLLAKKCADLELENARLQGLVRTTAAQSENDKTLDRPWTTNGHGHYEYIETICAAYGSGKADAANGKPLAYPHGRDHPDQNAAYEIGYVGGRDQQPLTTTERSIVGRVYEYLDATRSKPHAPGHSHTTPGVWDLSNKPEKAGKPCDWCALWNQFSGIAHKCSAADRPSSDGAQKEVG